MLNGSTMSSLQSTINSNSNNSNMLSNPFQEFSPEVSKQVSSYFWNVILTPIWKAMSWKSTFLLILFRFRFLQLKMIQCLAQWRKNIGNVSVYTEFVSSTESIGLIILLIGFFNYLTFFFTSCNEIWYGQFYISGNIIKYTSPSVGPSKHSQFTVIEFAW